MNDLMEIHRLDSAVVVVFQSAALMKPSDLDRLRHDLGAEIEQSRRTTLLDFSNVEFMSSQAIGLLLGLMKKISQIPGAELMLCCLAPRLMELLRLTRVERMVKVFANREAARDALNG